MLHEINGYYNYKLSIGDLMLGLALDSIEETQKELFLMTSLKK